MNHNSENGEITKANLNQLIKLSRDLIVQAKQIYNLDQEHSTNTHYASIKIALEQIELADSVNALISSDHHYGINALLRLMLERTVYIYAISKDPVRSASYLLSCQIEAIESINQSPLPCVKGSLVTAYEIDLGDTKIEIQLDRVDELKQSYKALFTNPRASYRWYNTDGNTPSIQALIAWLGGSEHLAADYRRLSHTVHTSGGFMYTELFLREKDYVKIFITRDIIDNAIINYLSAASLMLAKNYEIECDEISKIRNESLNMMVDDIVNSYSVERDHFRFSYPIFID